MGTMEAISKAMGKITATATTMAMASWHPKRARRAEAQSAQNGPLSCLWNYIGSRGRTWQIFVMAIGTPRVCEARRRMPTGRKTRTEAR